MIFLEPFGFANVNSVIFYIQKTSDYAGASSFGTKHKDFFLTFQIWFAKYFW